MAVHFKSKYAFPVGYHQFHKKQVFNFQLNRWHSLGYARFEDMEEAGGKIRTFADWKQVMRQLPILIMATGSRSWRFPFIRTLC
jgi:hypothetical protein